MKPKDFADLMQLELDCNADKGEWENWKPTMPEATRELDYHARKLAYALSAGDAARVTEHAADVGNMAMKIAELFGIPSSAEGIKSEKRLLEAIFGIRP